MSSGSEGLFGELVPGWPITTRSYNFFAGGEVGRIAALSDGIFAFAATVLVLDFHAPEAADVHSEAALIAALAASAPRLAPWLLTLMTLGIFWLGQQTQLSQLARSDRDLVWLHFVFLAVVTVLPFSTRLLADFLTYRAAFLIYWLNIAAPRRMSLRDLVVCRTGEAGPGGGAWRDLARGQAAHRRGAVALRDRRARWPCRRDARDRAHNAYSAELRDRAEAAHSLAPLVRP